MKIGKNGQIPSKQSVNLLMKENKALKPLKIIALLVVILVCAGLFSKFAVVDRLSLAARYQGQAAEAQALLEQARLANADYDEVLERYDRYIADDLTSDDEEKVDRMEVMALVEQYLMGPGAVESYTVDGNTVTIRFTVARLYDVSEIVDALYALERVTDVAVSTAATADASDRSSVTMQIELIRTGGED